jgi:hypothetical protein
VVEQASPAAKAALALRRTSGCKELHALLEDAKKNGDDRCLTPLKKLTRKSGCGFLNMADCYPCMRKDSALTDAIEAVKARPRPEFGAKPASAAKSNSVVEEQ